MENKEPVIKKEGRMKICILFDVDDNGNLKCPLRHKYCKPEHCPNYMPSNEDEIDPEIVRLILDTYLSSN